ncbi:MAG: hypothetical protein MHM6MM_005489 [Cercozoa sp. M6MM]
MDALYPEDETIFVTSLLADTEVKTDGLRAAFEKSCGKPLLVKAVSSNKLATQLEKVPRVRVVQDHLEANRLAEGIEVPEQYEDVACSTQPFFEVTFVSVLDAALSFCYGVFSQMDRFASKLSTRKLARFFLFSERCSSTQTLLAAANKMDKVPDGTLFLAADQTKGKGRGGNVWQSKGGSLLCSLSCRIPRHRARHLPFLQYLIALTLAESVDALRPRSAPGLVSLKWPNDLWLGRHCKVGGVIADTAFAGGDFRVIVGIGLNVCNSAPTAALNSAVLRGDFAGNYDFLGLDAVSPQEDPKALRCDDLLAEFCNRLEPALWQFERRGFAPFLDAYLGRWLHSGQRVTIADAQGEAFDAVLTGLTESGYLRATLCDSDDKVIELHPDGNTVDMLRGLIAPKLHKPA